MNKIFSFSELKTIRIRAIIITAGLVLYIYCTCIGYRMRDVFGAEEWEKEGPSGSSHGYSGHSHYFHK